MTTPTLHAAILATLGDLAHGAPGAGDKATALILSLATRLGATQAQLKDAAGSLYAITSQHQQGQPIAFDVVATWMASAMAHARAAEADSVESIATAPWIPIDLEGNTNPEEVDVLMRAQWFSNPESIRHFVGQFTEFGVYSDGCQVAHEWTVTHYAPLLPATDADAPNPLFILGRTSGLQEAAGIVRAGQEVPDPLDNGRSTIMEDWPDMDTAADAILAAIPWANA